MSHSLAGAPGFLFSHATAFGRQTTCAATRVPEDWVTAQPTTRTAMAAQDREVIRNDLNMTQTLSNGRSKTHRAVACWRVRFGTPTKVGFATRPIFVCRAKTAAQLCRLFGSLAC